MLDIKEERKYEELNKLGQELGIPIFEAFLELEVRNKDGKLIQGHKQRSHSWVRNAFNLMFTQLAARAAGDSTFGAGLLSARGTDGTVRWGAAIEIEAFGVDHPDFGYRAPAAVTTKGILVGSGTAAESFEDFRLQTPIAEGAGAGQLNHVASEPSSITWDSVGRVFRNAFARFFNNNSGGSITVNEVGLVGRLTLGGFHINALVSRDVLPTTVTVPNTGQLRVTYTISLTYPA